MTRPHGTPPSPPARYTCPMCAKTHFPTRCNKGGKPCGCCWAIDWFKPEPEKSPY